MSTLPKIRTVALDQCTQMETANPNVLGPERYELLVKGIQENGFVQPILVYEQDSQFVIVDGVHRAKAAREAGMSEVPAVVAPDPNRARILRLSLNKLRGELDQTVVGQDLLALNEDFELEELDLTGFTLSEVNVLLDMASETDEEDLLSGTSIDVPEEIPPKTYNHTVKFTSESARAQVKEALAQRPGLDDAQRLTNLLGLE